jgi:SAM domain (Sterile alpha motif)
MDKVANWLEKLGFGQYAARFVENDVTFAILSDLTDQDLKDIGVASLGHRRQLLRAIAERTGLGKNASEVASSSSAVPARQKMGPLRRAENSSVEKIRA